jgi:PAS domain S-box-containing protein
MNIMDINDQAIAEFGYSKEEFLNKTVIELHPKEDLRHSEKVLGTIKKKDSLIVETRFLKKDGTTFLAEAIPNKFLHGDQEIVQVVIRNINEIKEAEMEITQAKEKAEENERLYRLLIDSIPETSIHLVNKDLRYLALGGTELAKNNFDKSKVLGRTLREAFPKDIADKFETSFQKAFEGDSNDFEMDYEEFIYQQQILPVKDTGGNIFAAMQIATNITERKKTELALIESEKKYKAIFQNVQAAILVADDKGKYLSINDAATKLFGYSQDEFLQMKAGDIRTVEGENVEDKYKKYIEKGSESGEFEFLTKDNVARICQYVAIRPYPDLNISILMDITDLKKNQLKLKESEAHLKELNETKDKFFSIIAHDLKSPFNSIIGLTEILNEEASNYSAKQIQELAELIYTSSKLAFKLLNNLLQWSRLQTGAIKPNFTKIKPTDVVSEVKSLMESSANSKDIQLITEININEAIWADLEMVKTILRNLISNALKFTKPKGEVMVETQAKGDYILFIVTDTGVGIRADQMGNLFEINNKLSGIGTAKEKGTGLGLILCSEFIKLQGGQIWAESQLEIGSKFYFTLPKMGK